jgi:dihydroorotase
MKRLALIGGRVLDPKTGLDGLYDIFIMDGRVASLKPSSEHTEAGEGWETLDCKGLLVIPGLIDLHTHLREPGEEYKETIRTATLSAAAGGVTAVFAMPNTKPPNDNASVTRYIKKKAQEEGAVGVYPVGAITMGLKGEQLSEMAELKEAGCLAVSDDGSPVRDGGLMRRALEYSKMCGLVVISHAEDLSLSGGVMNEGETSTRLGLRGIPAQAETVMVARDILLCELTGARAHIAHVSALGSVELIRAAKKRGATVTAEATPHHLFFSDEALVSYDTDFKVNPPLRGKKDIEALREAIKDGTIDCIATDHAPHSAVEKDVEFDYASFGVVGLETSLSAVLSLVEEGAFTLQEAIRAMTANPACIMGLDSGTISVGSPADIAVVDLERTWVVKPQDFKSKGRNSPFKGASVKGKVVKTVVGGNIVFEEK